MMSAFIATIRAFGNLHIEFPNVVIKNDAKLVYSTINTRVNSVATSPQYRRSIQETALLGACRWVLYV